MVRKMNPKAIAAAIMSPKTPEPLRRGLIRKYGMPQRVVPQPAARPIARRGQMTPFGALTDTAGRIFRKRRGR